MPKWIFCLDLSRKHPSLILKRITDKEFYETKLPKKKYTLIVIRIDKNGDLASSKPCKHCTEFMKNSKIIKSVFYFDEQKNFKCEKIKDIQTNHKSNGWRHLREN